MRKQIVIFLAVFQTILFLTHWFVYQTWSVFRSASTHSGIAPLGAIIGFLSVTFLIASLLARKYSHLVVRLFYKLSAFWLGLLSFFFLAACGSWVAYAIVRVFHLPCDRTSIAAWAFGAALFVGLYGVLNAALIRVKRITVKLPNLPVSWQGRVVALVTDVHLGHVRGYRFAQRIVRVLSRLNADIVLIAGDLYDGTAVNERKLAEPWGKISAPLGTYFIEGNHEEFEGSLKYLDAVASSGVRVLNNEKVIVDGLQLVGVHYRDATDPDHFRKMLRKAAVDPNAASILLTHAPNNLPVVAEEKIGLQLSGHTHAGQFFPFTLITSRIYGPFVYGLRRLGNLQVYTSCGAGTWGPPMRVGTTPEIVLIGLK